MKDPFDTSKALFWALVIAGVFFLAVYCTHEAKAGDSCASAEGSYELIPRPRPCETQSPHVAEEPVQNGQNLAKIAPCLLQIFAPDKRVLPAYLDAPGARIMVVYDRNDDGRIDAATLEAPGAPYVEYYGMDIDFDGSRDILLRDAKMNGECDAMITEYSKYKKQPRDPREES